MESTGSFPGRTQVDILMWRRPLSTCPTTNHDVGATYEYHGQCGREYWAERMTKENCSRKRNSQDAGIKREETRIREDFHAKEASFAGASCPLINCE